MIYRFKQPTPDGYASAASDHQIDHYITDLKTLPFLSAMLSKKHQDLSTPFPHFTNAT